MSPPRDRFAPESYEDHLCVGKTAQECAEIRRRLAEQEEAAAQEADKAMKEDDGKQWNDK